MSTSRRPNRRPLILSLCVTLALAGCSTPKAITSAPPSSAATSSASSSKHPPASKPATPAPKGINKIDHLIFVVQENRSFDEYFGTYPGADGLPKNVCIPDSVLGHCVTPWHDTDQNDEGGPHTLAASNIDINHGKMDGFVTAAIKQPEGICARTPTAGDCPSIDGPHGSPEVMGYHNRSEIPNYWSYADNYVLQDHMFAPEDSWTLPSHLFLFSAWSAVCSTNSPKSCTSALGAPDPAPQVPKSKNDTPYKWTDITWLLHKAHVSWNYFVAPGGICYANACDKHNNWTTGYQNPVPGFADVRQDKELNRNTPYTKYFSDAKNGTLPSVSWVMPAIGQSEHPGKGPISDGQEFVTKVVNAAMQGPDWNSTAVFVTWDDWGGFYDHVQPPRVDINGYGLRVPGLMISPYAKQGFIDHQVLSFDAYLKLIEDRFLNGARLDPKTDGRPDSRPTVREDEKKLGDLVKEFDFTQPPRKPMVLNPTPG
jgi:phospholipase C